jgi:hypothetical protein
MRAEQSQLKVDLPLFGVVFMFSQACFLRGIAVAKGLTDRNSSAGDAERD